jgi:hypothetical protein
MPRRVKNRGRLGRRASVLLRSLYSLVLGLGGWFLASLTVLTVVPAVPIAGAAAGTNLALILVSVARGRAPESQPAHERRLAGAGAAR